MCVVEEKYKLGIEIIDNQHQKIFDMINGLCDDCSNEILKEMIIELKDYSLYHFETEETYFKEKNFNDSANHIRLHEIFSETIDFYFQYPENLNKEKIYIFLNNWIKRHILIEDKKYTLKENLKQKSK